MVRKPLEFYLVPKPRRTFGIGLIVVAIAAIVLWLVLIDWRQYGRSKLVDDQLHKLQSERAAHMMSTQSHQQTDEAKQWALVRVEKDFPWERVFRAIERTASQDIELLEFHPDKINRTIVLRGEAKHVDGLLAYIQDLTVKTSWTNVHLTHQEKVRHGALETISFEIKATL